MGLDPLTAVSLAASVIQFVDFGCELFAKGREIRQSKAGITEKFAELKLTSESLSALSLNLSNASRAATSFNNLSDEEQGLLRLADASQIVAERLATAIEVVRASELKHGKVGSFVAALKHCWSEDKVHGLEDRLRVLQQQLGLQLLVSLRYGLLNSYARNCIALSRLTVGWSPRSPSCSLAKSQHNGVFLEDTNR